MPKYEFIKFTKRQKQELQKSKEDEEWLRSWKQDDYLKYSGKYIAIKNKKVMIASKNLNEVYDKLNKKKIKMALIKRVEEPTLVVY